MTSLTLTLLQNKSQNPESTTKLAAEVAYGRQKCRLRRWGFKRQVFYIVTECVCVREILWQRGERLIT